jgi:segregation and condensation protein B
MDQSHELMAYELMAKIEALLVAADKPVEIAALARCLAVPIEEVDVVLGAYAEELLSQLRRSAGTVRIEVKPPYVPLIGELFPERKAKPLSSQAREVLAVIALKQPIPTQGVTEIRGFDSSAAIANLAERGFIRRLKTRCEHGERKWKVTQRFLDAFNLDRVEDLYKDEIFERTFPELAEPVGETDVASGQ